MTVTTVPIVVTSTTGGLLRPLCGRTIVDGARSWRSRSWSSEGAAGTTTLAENVEALPADHYRVEKYLVTDPADVDGDCMDDLTELSDPVVMNPVNAAPAIAFSDGAVAIPDNETLRALGHNVGDKTYLKFLLVHMYTDTPGVYFLNGSTHSTHQAFMEAAGLELRDVIAGDMAYHPDLVARDGSRGVYSYSLQGGEFTFSFESRAYALLAASLPLLDRNLALYIPGFWRSRYGSELSLIEASRINPLYDADIVPPSGFLALNPGLGYGRLQVRAPGERPHPRDVAIYEVVPNEMSRVAGIITTVPQTPLSHTNLRAVQDGIPNAFIRDVLDATRVTALLGGYVRYEVTEGRWDLRQATPEEVDLHYESSRPAAVQTPERDLSVAGIKPLGEIGFNDWKAFGVKAANVAVLGTLGFPAGTVPDGFAVPFYFYDEFMKAHGFYDDVTAMLADPDFQTDFDVQDDMLDDLRDAIEDAETPQWIVDDLTTMHATYPEGQSLRYRSSTNNEDLPGFNGAGLYDSKTQNPDETVEDGIDKSLKGVFASLWTFRAFTEREFYRIDHLAAAMGVLVHPNYKDELANGVAVSFDPVYGSDTYYVNTQLGEDLVTNPEAYSVPEEILLRRSGTYTVLATSNLVEHGQLLMRDEQLRQLREHLEVIHDRFAQLYDPGPGEPFAMEIEFKITSDNILAIKQARPWVFSAGNGGGSAGGSTGGGGSSGGGGSGGGGGGLRWRRRWFRWRWRRRPAPNGAGRAHESRGGGHRCGGDADVGRAGGRRRLCGHGLRIPDQQEEPLDLHRFHRHDPYGHWPRQRHGIRLRGAGGQQNRQELFFHPGRGHAGSAGSVYPGLCAFRQRHVHHLRSGVGERGPPAGPPRYLFLRHRGRSDCRRIGAGGDGRSGDPRGRRADGPNGDGSPGSAHDFDPRARGAGVGDR